jgi:hypothetical protein
MAKKPIFSIIVEAGTRSLTDSISMEDSVRGHLSEARNFSKNPSDVEVIYVGIDVPPENLLPKNCYCLRLPKIGYYGWKNAGAQAARGRYVVFWDSDCRPKKGYLRSALEAFRKDPKLIAIGGVSQYDGEHFLARMNTVLSFGYLYQGKGFGNSVALSHNVVIRKDKFPDKPFGPYNFRVGGDMYLTQMAAKRGQPVQLNPHLRIFHEDPSFSLTALLERHLRGLFEPLLWYPLGSRVSAIAFAFRAVAGNLRRWTRKVFREGPAMGFNGWEAMLSIPVLLAYTLLDALAVSVLALCPPLLTKLLENHLGPKFSEGWQVAAKVRTTKAN